ncbi:NAD-dependent epimerase/dehydratase family protein [Microbacterium sp.]|jgi:nucleoside-diphosphate-sugar epimerase|uniref:NAD-dependent epimerase/dehydratase family protein n=1 Tax=Microbacterium sp. TaxID=51671 RepID=UPI0037C797D3
MNTSHDTVLVTGASGYLGSRIVTDLLQRGTDVRATVRSLDAEPALREAVRRGGADDRGLDVVVASLTDDDGWDAAVAGIAGVYHVASPMTHLTEDPEIVVTPARDGALRVLRAARNAGVARVVLTSSFAAVGYSQKPLNARGAREFDEHDWTDPDAPGLPAYPRSKTVAERAAWDFVRSEGGGLELVVLNPTWIAGPALTSDPRSSLQALLAMLSGGMPVAPRQRFGIADVRDVSTAHLSAMHAPDAAGKRYLLLADGPTTTWLGVATVLRDHFGELAVRTPREEAPGDDLPPLVIHNERAKAELGFAPRSAESTIVETVEDMRERGMLDRSL